MLLKNRLDKIIGRYEELETTLSSGNTGDNQQFAKLSKEHAHLSGLVGLIKRLNSLCAEKEDATALLSDSDPEIRKMAEDDLSRISTETEDVDKEIRIMLLPKDEADSKNAILEARAGTGGEEAALFAGDLLRMYSRYAENRGWKVELLSISESSQGGVKEASISITGSDVFSNMKFEAGVHRVQRVPETEASGRVHTSAATIAVLPEAEEVDIQIDEKDLKIDVFRSSGPGGQSVNTTDSAVRITHIPTGVVVSQQDEKSQHKNKAKAMKVLRARLYEKKREEEEAERSSSRKSQVGSGDRSERIRTYNFPQNRVTDHRINLTMYNLDRVMEGDALDEIIKSLISHDRAQKLAEES